MVLLSVLEIIGMSSQKSKECILQTIDQLRQRKARPDIVRICHMATRKHGMKWQETEAQLEKLVDSGTVVKVEYKGNVSYRNAAKWKKNPFGEKVVKSVSICKKLREAVKDLTKPESDKGSSLKEIEKWLVAHYTDARVEKAQLKFALEKELQNGHLEKHPNGGYVAKEAKRTVEQVSERKTTGACKTSVLGPTLGRRGRPPSKRKKFKKTHGPDFEMPSLGKRGPSLDENATCDYCLKTDSANNTGLRDEILVCKDCNAKAHPSCMGYNETLAKRALDSPWQCIDCKTCYVCEDSGDADIMLFCDSCDKGYHMSCHNPPVRDKPQGKWECQSCYLDSTNDISMEAEDTEDIMDEGQVFEGSGASCLPTPCDSPVTSDDEEYFKKETKSKKKPEITRKKTPSVVQTDVSIVDNNYPDASKWTVDDVARFFTELGFKEQVEALREQEIDGQSLLLMKRSDVLTGLSIRLGPALKMYQHVMKLQLTGVDLETIS